jgi:hypothetical protein
MEIGEIYKIAQTILLNFTQDTSNNYDLLIIEIIYVLIIIFS